MAVKIRLKRLGKVRVPQYRIVVVDSRKKRDGRVIEEIGKYHPKEDPSYIDVVSERAQYWLGVGAQPTEAVEAILKITGDWQTFKGLPGAEGTLKVAAPKPDKLEIFNEALKEAAASPRARGDQEGRQEGREGREGLSKAEKARPRPRRGSPRGPAEAVAALPRFPPRRPPRARLPRPRPPRRSPPRTPTRARPEHAAPTRSSIGPRRRRPPGRRDASGTSSCVAARSSRSGPTPTTSAR